MTDLEKYQYEELIRKLRTEIDYLKFKIELLLKKINKQEGRKNGIIKL